MRFLGIDYGDKKTGISISDPLQIIAQELSVLPTNKELPGKIQKYIEEYQIQKVILGRPTGVSSGKDTQQTEKVLQFAQELKKYIEKEIVFIDERYTSKLIHDALKGEKRKPKDIDAMSACLILQSYLDSLE